MDFQYNIIFSVSVLRYSCTEIQNREREITVKQYVQTTFMISDPQHV